MQLVAAALLQGVAFYMRRVTEACSGTDWSRALTFAFNRLRDMEFSLADTDACGDDRLAVRAVVVEVGKVLSIAICSSRYGRSVTHPFPKLHGSASVSAAGLWSGRNSRPSRRCAHPYRGPPEVPRQKRVVRPGSTIAEETPGDPGPRPFPYGEGFFNPVL